jgi:hypothetical protein
MSTIIFCCKFFIFLRNIPKIPLYGVSAALGAFLEFPSMECRALLTGLARKLARPANGEAV